MHHAQLAQCEEPNDYVAFATKHKLARLRIRSADDSICAPAYSALLNLRYDQQGTHFILTYSVMLVMVRGRNLQAVVFAIENGMADFIQEFDGKRWPEPTDMAAPFIESIKVENSHSGERGSNGR